MKCDFNPNDFIKVPGFIPISELPDVLDMEGDSVVMRAGTLDDGTPLFEVFRRGKQTHPYPSAFWECCAQFYEDAFDSDE
jgi:hypothetical protein